VAPTDVWAVLTSRSIFVAAALVLAVFVVSLTAGARAHTPAPPPAAATPVSVYAVAGTSPLTLVTGHTDERFSLCPGARVGSAPVVAGDFVTVSVNDGCVDRLAVLAPPVCTASGPGSYMAGRWVGSNPTAHSVLFRTAGPQASIEAARWCSAPRVVSPGGTVLSLVQIPPLAAVRVVSSAGGWVTEVVVDHPALAPVPTSLDARS
jgi:hypothetical protein